MIEQAFLDHTIKRLKEYKALGDKTFQQLTEAEMQQDFNGANSIAIIIQHMHGNMLSRWTNFLTEDGEKSWRKRDEEFEATTYNKEQLIGLWEEGWKVFLDAVTSLQPGNLMEKITIRTQPLLVLDAIQRQVAHYSYHVGQIVYIGKMLRGNEWMSLSIPKGGSQTFNEQLSQSRH